jgi:hypothetical protein
MAKVTSITKVYPMDSVVSAGSDGLPVYDRAYNASDLRQVMASYLGDGIMADEGDECAVTSTDGTWSVGTGAAMADGLLVHVDEACEVLAQSELTTGQYAYVILAARFDTAYRDAATYSVVSTSASYTPVRDASTWELVLARIDWRGTCTDYRMDDSMCGVCAPFATLDTDSLMLELRTAVSQFDLNVGTVTSQEPGTTPTVTVRKPVEAGGTVYIDFGIPRGATGEPGQSAPGVYVQEDQPTNPSEGTVWLGTDPDTRQIEKIQAYEVTGTYPGEFYPGERYPGGTAAWASYTIDPALITGATS